MSHRIAGFCLITILIFNPFYGNSQTGNHRSLNQLAISYMGNMGVHISGPGVSVVIDGLHEYYGPEYLNPPDSEIRKIISKQHPFDKLNTVLFTHYHRDHHSSNLAKRFLQVSLKNRVAGPPQVTDSLPPIQTLNAWNKNEILFRDSSAGLFIYAFNIPHTWQQRHSKVQNVAYLVRSRNYNILHTGDADTDINAFSRLRLSKTDIMIVPIWFLMDKEGIRIIQEIIKPGKLVVTHISPNEKHSLDKYRLSGIETYFFTEINQLLMVPPFVHSD